MSRRMALMVLPVGLAGCVSGGMPVEPVATGPDPYFLAMYGPKPDELFPLPAIDIKDVDPKFFRQQVRYHRYEEPGTLVVDTANRYLYLVQEGGMAMRYGIGVGREGLAFEGVARVGRKAEWPRWTPTQGMIEREPERYGPLADGMEPGLTNPLGPRALYLFQGNRDTLYRIHGTSEPWSIGQAMSSGCIRLFNQDIIDLYNRVPLETTVLVLQNEPPMMDEAPLMATASVPEAPQRRWGL